MVTREEAEAWAEAQSESVVEPTPAEWFGYTVTDGEPPGVPREGGGTQQGGSQVGVTPKSPAAADEPEPAPAPAPEPVDFNAMTKAEICEYCYVTYEVELDGTQTKAELVAQVEALEAGEAK